MTSLFPKAIPLRVLLPIVILVIGLSVTLITFMISLPLMRSELIREQTENSILTASSLQTILETSAGFDNALFDQEVISVVMASTSTYSTIIIDSQGTVKASSTFELVGRPATDVITTETMQLLPQAQRTIAPLISTPKGQLELTTVVRLCYDRSTAKVPNSPCDSLVINHDLTEIYNDKLKLLYTELSIHIVGVILSALVTILLVWQKLLIPLRHIRAVLLNYARGNVAARVSLVGGGETHLLGEEIDNLLDFLEETKESSEFSEQRFRAMFENNTEGMVVITEQGFITNINPAAETVFGYQPGELMGARVERLMPTEHAAHHSQYITNYTATGDAKIIGTRGRNLYGQRKDGTIFPIRLGVGEVVTGHSRYFVGTIVDLTEISQLQDQLQRSQKMDAIGQLAGGIAHDFNNLLSIVIGNLDLLERKLPEDAATKKHVIKARGAAMRGTDLTRRLLGFSKKRTDKIAPTDINNVIENMSDLIQRSVTSSIETKLVLADDLWHGQVDPSQLEDVLINFAINARDAMPNGGRLIIESRNHHRGQPLQAQIQEGPANADYVEISITDTGHGIPAHIREKIFEPFFSTKDEAKGTGLGLAMINNFVKRVGGALSLYSELDFGTTFRLYLPRALNANDVSKSIQPVEENFPRGRESILIVDDEPELSEVAAEILSSLGYQVITANSGAGALEILERDETIELLFSDIIMSGGINGFELAHQAQALKPKLKILLTSGFTGSILMDGIGANWQARILKKPYQTSELAQRVRRLLDGIEA